MEGVEDRGTPSSSRSPTRSPPPGPSTTGDGLQGRLPPATRSPKAASSTTSMPWRAASAAADRQRALSGRRSADRNRRSQGPVHDVQPDVAEGGMVEALGDRADDLEAQ